MSSLNVAQAAPDGAADLVPMFSGQAVIQQVNQVRASNGLPPYNINGALMAAAQSHSEYQAAIGSTSHSGSGGSSVTSRAIAAGYGGGAAVSVVENVYSGMNAGAEQAVSWWRSEGTHMATLISAKHQDAGAGMATSDGVVYITLVVGSVTGAPGSAETQMAWSAQATGQAPNTGGQSGATAPAAQASSAPAPSAATSTPDADGAIIHEVASGETLWMIANRYKIGLADMLRVNGLNDAAVIRPGQKIIIQPAGSLPTATAAMLNAEGTPVETGDATGQPTATRPAGRTATRTPRPTQAALAEMPAAAASPASAGEPRTGALDEPEARNGPGLRFFGLDPLLVLIGALVLGGAGLLIAGSLLNRGE